MSSLELAAQSFEQSKGFRLILPYQDRPSDKIGVTDKRVEGEAYFYDHGATGWILQCTEFQAEITKPLSPFKYCKPEVTDNPFSPSEEWETKERTQYYPLVVVKDALRGPNHWHRKDDAIICGLWVKDHWETRYFPKNNIPESTWQEAMELLGEPSK